MDQISILKLRRLDMWISNLPGYHDPPWFVFEPRVVDLFLRIESPEKRWGRECLALIPSFNADDPPVKVVLRAVDGNELRVEIDNNPEIHHTSKELEARGYNFSDLIWVAYPVS